MDSQPSTCSSSFTRSLTPPSLYHRAVWVSVVLRGEPLPPGGALLSRGTDYAAPHDGVLIPTDTGRCVTRGRRPSEHGSDARWSPKRTHTNMYNIEFHTVGLNDS